MLKSSPTPQNNTFSWTKKRLAITLSRLKTFSSPKVSLEQYSTDSEIAAELLWQACLQGDITGKTIADFGSGTGILGLGALLLGAKTVFFIESEPSCIPLYHANLATLTQTYQPSGTATLYNKDITQFDHHVDTIIQNPPFGTKTKHQDKLFLEQAFIHANTIWSLHKVSTRPFIEQLSQDHGFTITHHWARKYPIKAQHTFHTRRIYYIDVGIWRCIHAHPSTNTTPQKVRVEQAPS